MSPEISVFAAAHDDGPGPIRGTDVTFLPLAADDGTGVYSDATPELIRELEAAGVTARTWHPGGECEFVGERGPVADLLLEFGVGVASSGGWYALESLLRRRGGKVKVSVVLETDGQRRRIEASGDASGVAGALAKLGPFASERSG